MAPVDLSANPRFLPTLSALDLTTRTLRQLMRSNGASPSPVTPLQHAALVLVKCFQQLHYFSEPCDIPGEI